MHIVGRGKKGAFVFLLDRQKKLLECKASYGKLLTRFKINKTHIPLSENNIVTWVIKNQRAKIVKNVALLSSKIRKYKEKTSF